MAAARSSADEFEVEPYTPQEIRFHVAGTALNGLCWLVALVWLAATWSEHRPAWPWLALATLAGLYAADLVSGILHWAFDTWFDASVPFVRRMVQQVREHHIYPHRIFKIRFTHDVGTLSWICLIMTTPLVLWAITRRAGSVPIYLAVCAAEVFSPLLVCMLEFHKCGHRGRNPLCVRALQRMRLVLSVPHHVRHHSGNHDINYCIINGWADGTLGRLGLFRVLERSVSRLTGARPQRDDHEFLQRYGRSLVRRRTGGEPKAAGQ